MNRQNVSSAGQYFLLLACLFLLTGRECRAQRNLSGKQGLIYIPDAEKVTDGTWTVGYNYNPINYSLRKNQIWSEQILYTDLALLPGLNLTFILLQGRENGKRVKKEALGDRQLDLRLQLIKEKRYRPAMALIMSSPFTIDAALQTHVLVATKSITHKKWEASLTAGFGSPYYFYRDEDNLNNGNIFSNFELQKKSEDRYGNNYLTGLFGGIKVGYADHIHLMMEWDGQKMNTGLHALFFKRINLQVSVLNFDQFSYGISLQQSLNN
ncbi:YjbH domain-containing protein [Jiulongibacter sp. NS-SX5]|uniref:YjbH domain-containing protein n=1 Tax=Jiulongibacter sp. NS-SX5 TaxID=3463854 RepID=UPI00405899FE